VNLKGFRVAMSVIAAALLAMMLSGCGGDDDGLSADDMARISAIEQETADAKEETAEQQEQIAELNTTIQGLRDQLAASDSDEEIAMLTQQIADLVAEIAKEPEPVPDPGYQPSDPGGTLEGSAERAAAQRIASSVGMVEVTAAVPGVDANTDGDFADAGDSPPVPAGRANRISGGVSIKDLTQARLGEDPMLSLAVTGGTGLSTAMDSADTDAPALSGWTGVALEKAGPGGVTQMALVYSDAERSVRAFDDVYSYNRNALNVAEDVALTHRWVLAPTTADDTDPLPAEPSDLLKPQDPGGLIVFNHELSTTGVMTRTVRANSNANITADLTPTSVRGTYDNVPGEFTCAEADCVISITSTGAVRLSGAENAALLFKADDPDTVIPDRDYLAFGVWTEVPDQPTLSNPGRTRAFVHGSAGPFKSTEIMELNGTATYNGAAVGHWATRAKGSHLAEQGRFTATATLNANFDGGVQPVAPLPALLSGAITSFMDEDGTEMPGWRVSLDRGSMMGEGPADANGVDVDGATSGTSGSLSWSGVWEAWFFGTNTNSTPTGVAGNFQAVAGTAQPMITDEARIDLFNDEGFAGVVGSFGAR